MKKLNIHYTSRYAVIHNEREKRLVEIMNDDIDNISKKWKEDASWRRAFLEDRFLHPMFKSVYSKLEAMYFLDMLDEPRGIIEMFENLKEECEAEWK